MTERERMGGGLVLEVTLAALAQVARQERPEVVLGPAEARALNWHMARTPARPLPPVGPMVPRGATIAALAALEEAARQARQVVRDEVASLVGELDLLRAELERVTGERDEFRSEFTALLRQRSGR